MGVDCPNVQEVVHYGPSSDVESYIQETGRAGRDGCLALALLIRKPLQGIVPNQELKKYMENTTSCRRDILFQDIDNYKHVDMGHLCVCCDICAKKCVCGVCKENYVNFVFTS